MDWKRTNIQLPDELVPFGRARICWWHGQGMDLDQEMVDLAGHVIVHDIQQQSLADVKSLQRGWSDTGAVWVDWAKCEYLPQRAIKLLTEFQRIVAQYPAYAEVAHREFLQIPEYALVLADDLPGALYWDGQVLRRPSDQRMFLWEDMPSDADLYEDAA